MYPHDKLTLVEKGVEKGNNNKEKRLKSKVRPIDRQVYLQMVRV